MSIKKTKIWKFFSSIRLAIWLLAFIAITSIIGTLIPQNKEAMEYISRYGQDAYNLLLKIGFLNVYSAWWFLLLLCLLSFNLAVCLFNRFSLKLRLLGTLMSHVSILVILGGALVGMFFGQKGYVRIFNGHSISSFSSKGKEVKLDFSLRLDKFIYEEYIDKKEKLEVYAKDGKLIEEIYPEISDEVAISNMGSSVKILRYVPDFSMDTKTKEVISRTQEPKNPAIEIELKNKEGQVSRSWVFARFPDIHQSLEKDLKFKYLWMPRRPKNFISKVTVIKEGKEIKKQDIAVNFPLRFDGYAFFQSSYDKKKLQWSGIQIVKDPGVPIVYAGFALLIIGLIMIFYINPLIKKRG